MHPVRQVPVAACLPLEQIKVQYHSLRERPPISIEELFAPQNFSFGSFCQGFETHARAEDLKGQVQAFGEAQEIWLSNSRHHVTCALFLYPNGEFSRMLTIMKNLILGFYLNDVMGRDVFRWLSPEQQRTARKQIAGMATLPVSLEISVPMEGMELINLDILREFKANSPRSWFKRFMDRYCHHLNVTHADCNSNALGYVPGITEYIEKRCYYAGVHHVVLWIEYSDNRFLDWTQLQSLNLDRTLDRLHWLTAAFGSLCNDFFSFEKEVIDHDSDSNLIMVVLQNNPGSTLLDAITSSARIVRSIVTEFIVRLNEMHTAIEGLSHHSPGLSKRLGAHVQGIARCVQATWLWHMVSKRYKRDKPLWRETRL